MSKIAEKRALEVYPPEYEQEDFNETWDTNEQYREPYIEGYDQAMQDFLDKACEWLSKQSMPKSLDWNIEDFKNYMQNESEN